MSNMGSQKALSLDARPAHYTPDPMHQRTLYLTNGASPPADAGPGRLEQPAFCVIRDGRTTFKASKTPGASICSLVPSATEILYALGVGDRVVSAILSLAAWFWRKGGREAGWSADPVVWRMMWAHDCETCRFDSVRGGTLVVGLAGFGDEPLRSACRSLRVLRVSRWLMLINHDQHLGIGAEIATKHIRSQSRSSPGRAKH